MWTHKIGNQVINTQSIYESKFLCDDTIFNYSVNYDSLYGTKYDAGPYFYNIDQNVSPYDSWYYYGHNSNSTGTEFYNAG